MQAATEAGSGSGLIQPAWQGESAVLIASGPSLTDADICYVQGRCRVGVVSDGYRKAPWADFMYSYDPEWWEFHAGCPSFHGAKWTANWKAAQAWGLHFVKGVQEYQDDGSGSPYSAKAPGISFDPSRIYYGGNSGFQALNLAVLFGVKRVFLLGYDMQRTNNKAHWFGEHPAPINRNTDYAIFIRAFTKAAPILKDRGIEVINCSRETALTCFPRANIQDVLK